MLRTVTEYTSTGMVGRPQVSGATNAEAPSRTWLGGRNSGSSGRTSVVVTPPHTNRSQRVEFPPVAIRKYRRLDGSCREAILDVLAGADAAAGEPMTCNDVRALLQANDAVHSADTVHKALRRMADDGILTWAEGG